MRTLDAIDLPSVSGSTRSTGLFVKFVQGRPAQDQQDWLGKLPDTTATYQGILNTACYTSQWERLA